MCAPFSAGYLPSLFARPQQQVEFPGVSTPLAL
jgi:hypothetical protein